MVTKVVRQVTELEKEEIMSLYQRKLALSELMRTLYNTPVSIESKDELYERILADLGKTGLQFETWWSEKASKYNWESAKNGSWNITFDTNEISLVCIEPM